MKWRPRRDVACFIPFLLALASPVWGQPFDHGYPTYAKVLREHVVPPRVDYAALRMDRADLDRAVDEFDSDEARNEPRWTREQRMAFWVNAYNVFTLRAIVDHYPIRSRWWTRHPRNSIRQIEGVWTTLSWRAAGRTVTLDDIEHRILRPEFKDARVHFAVNCASVSCPPLSGEPYVAHAIDEQLDQAARTYLKSPEGVKVVGETLLVSSLFKWYGEDFVSQYAALSVGQRPSHERATLGAIIQYGPPEAAALARTGRTALRYIPYDWSLNDRR